MNSIARKILVISCLAATFPSQMAAQEAKLTQTSLTLEENAEERINLSGKLRMLSQRIPSAACHLTRGIDVQGSKKLLESAGLEFEKILTALEKGDADLNIINPETSKKTLVRISELREQWEPVKASVTAVVQGTDSEEDINLILTQNVAVLKAAVSLVPQLVKQYSNPNAVPYDKLLLIDVSGRQRMLTQKASKEACLLGTAHKSENTLKDLEATMTIFEASLNALRHGMPTVGVAPPPNKDIAVGLETVVGDWGIVKPHLTTILAGEVLEADALVENFQGLNTTMANMNKVVGMYALSAKPAS